MFLHKCLLSSPTYFRHFLSKSVNKFGCYSNVKGITQVSYVADRPLVIIHDYNCYHYYYYYYYYYYYLTAIYDLEPNPFVFEMTIKYV